MAHVHPVLSYHIRTRECARVTCVQCARVAIVYGVCIRYGTRELAQNELPTNNARTLGRRMGAY